MREISRIYDVKDNLSDILQVKNITDTTADIYFYGDIVSSWWGAWDDEDQYPESVKQILESSRNKNLNIHVNSGGGSVFAGITIYNMLKNHNGYKTVYIDGIAASIASVIALAGDRVIMRTGSSLMIHKPSVCIWGGYNSDELNKMATDLDVIQECIMQVYRENLAPGASIEEIEKMVNAETWLTSDEASKFFNVEIENKVQAVAYSSEFIDKFIEVPEKVRNTFINIKNELEMEEEKIKLLEMEI